MHNTTATCSDVIVAFDDARATAGQDEALKVIRRFGARYAATVPSEHYDEVLTGLRALVHSHQSKTGQKNPWSKPKSPEEVKAGWTVDAPNKKKPKE